MTKTWRNVLLGIGFLLLLFVLWYFSAIVVYIVIAAIISLIGHPLVNFLSKIKIKRFYLPRGLSAAITLILIWTLVILFFRIFIPLIANQANQLSAIDPARVSEKIQEPMNYLENIFGNLPISGAENLSLQEYVSQKVVSVVSISQLSNIFSSITGALGNLFIAIFSISFISFFFLKEEDLFTNSLLVFTPSGNEEKMRHVIASVRKLLIRYFIGISIEVSLVMILVSLGLSVVGLNFDTAVVIGLFVGLMNVIPYVGPIIGAAFGIIIGIATNINMEIYSELLPLVSYMAIVFLAVQIIDNIFFQPLIYSSSVNAHPLEIFLVIMIAGSIGGITGMVIAIPVYTILRVMAKEFLSKFKVVQKLTQSM